MKQGFFSYATQLRTEGHPGWVRHRCPSHSLNCIKSSKHDDFLIRLVSRLTSLTERRTFALPDPTVRSI